VDWNSAPKDRPCMAKTPLDNLDAADSGARHQFTTAPITVLTPTNEMAILPVWVRLPSPGKIDPITSLPRSSMWELVQRSNGRIRTVSLRKAGAVKGTRLINLQSLLSFLDGVTGEEGEA
jgi:hypothetical protein